jgi:high-affinity iron transporter
MTGSALILLREGLEGALIVAIVLGYLKKIGRRDQFRAVWLGTVAALATSALAGVLLFATVGDLEGDARKLTFALVMAMAAGVLTWMIFWMRRQARAIKGQLQARVDGALLAGSLMAMAAVVYFSLAREGLETSLFFLAATGENSSVEAFAGGALGLLGAIVLAYAVYRGAAWLNLRQFFAISGALILLLAGGLLARSVAELQVVGALPTFWYPVFDASSIPLLDGHGFGGQALHGLFGWDPAPSAEELGVWLAYVAVVGTLYFRRAPLLGRRRAAPVPQRDRATARAEHPA